MPQQQVTRETEAPQQTTIPAPFDDGAEPRGTGQVRIIAGADVQDVELVGRTVGEARGVAQLLFGISPAARALVDGREVAEDHILGEAQVLEFTKHAGRKGAAMPNVAATPPVRPAATIELAGDRAEYRREGTSLATAGVGDLLARVAASGAAPATWRLPPRQARWMTERADGRAAAVVIEMPPGPRQIRWISDRARDPVSGKVEKRRLSFPWVVLLVVFQNGELANVQQAFFRTAPLTSLDDRLAYTNLLNVASGYKQSSWVCMFNLERSLEALSWDDRVRAVIDHFWQAAYTRSADMAEGNSYWAKTRGLDPRLETPAAWEEATAREPYFTLQIPWKPAPCTVREELAAMLDMVAPWQPVERAEQLATLMQRGR